MGLLVAVVVAVFAVAASVLGYAAFAARRDETDRRRANALLVLTVAGRAVAGIGLGVAVRLLA
jgi:hypothetical protein